LLLVGAGVARRDLDPIFNGFSFQPRRPYVEAGQRITGAEGALPRSTESHLRLRAGQRLLLIGDRPMRVLATSAVDVRTKVDCPAVKISNQGIPYRETQLGFDGTAGDWVNLERVGVPKEADLSPVLVGPSGYQFLRVSNPYWHLPVTGHYRLMVPTGAEPFAGKIRVRRMRLLPQPMPTDGTRATFTTGSPGEWMIAEFDMPGSQAYWLHVGSFTATGDWSAFAEKEHRHLCDWTGGLDCGTGDHVEVDASHPDSSPDWPLTGCGLCALVVRMPSGTSGSVTLSLDSSATSGRTAAAG
jgi:hypothetical protein